MPERAATQKPTIIAGTNVSGTLGPNTGQVNFTLGGQRAYTKASGTAGGNAAIWVGAGRLESIVLHPPGTRTVAGGADVASGMKFTFYDSATVVSGLDDLAASGKTILWQGFSWAPEGFTSGFRLGRDVPGLAMPFTSGLNFISMSGQDGFTVSYTPVISGNTGQA